MTNIYNYHPQTKELLRVSEARLDPIEHKPLVPAFATLAEPPETKEHEAAIFMDNAWQVVADYRGTEYWLADGSHITIANLAEVLPEDALLHPPVASEKKTSIWKRLLKLQNN